MKYVKCYKNIRILSNTVHCLPDKNNRPKVIDGRRTVLKFKEVKVLQLIMTTGAGTAASTTPQSVKSLTDIGIKPGKLEFDFPTLRKLVLGLVIKFEKEKKLLLFKHVRPP